MNIDGLPRAAGIYAIVNRTNGHRYVGQAANIHARVKQHLNDLLRGKEATNKGRLLQIAWDQHGRDSFEAVVLELIHDNSRSTNYHERPDNLSLAEHFYINERAEYNADRAIVRGEFRDLIHRKEWRTGLVADNENRENVVVERAAFGSASRSGTPKVFFYMVAERRTRQHPVLVRAADEREAKRIAIERDSRIRSLGTNISCWRLSAAAADRALGSGAIDLR
jgi:predicted GIY-YIG superfamily endonuclease